MTDEDINNGQTIAVKVYNELEQEFLCQFAIEHGLKAWIKPDSHNRVYFEATCNEVETHCKKAEPAFQILAYHRHGLIVEAMLYAGSKRSWWSQVISQTQGRILIFIKKNRHLSPVLKAIEKARDEVPPRMQFVEELLKSLDDGYEDLVQSQL